MRAAVLLASLAALAAAYPAGMVAKDGKLVARVDGQESESNLAFIFPAYLRKRENEQVEEPDFAIPEEPDNEKRENEQVEEPDFEIQPEADD